MTNRTLLAIVAMTFVSSACAEELSLEDTPPSILAVGPVEAGTDGNVLVTYSITDLEGDDATLEALVCRGNECTPAYQGDGGDGLGRVPTVPEEPGGQSATHVFAWDAACGSIDASSGDRIPAAADEEISIGLRLAGTDDSPTQSAPFTLDSLGYESDGGSGIVAACNDA